MNCTMRVFICLQIAIAWEDCTWGLQDREDLWNIRRDSLATASIHVRPTTALHYSPLPTDNPMAFSFQAVGRRLMLEPHLAQPVGSLPGWSSFTILGEVSLFLYALHHTY